MDILTVLGHHLLHMHPHGLYRVRVLVMVWRIKPWKHYCQHSSTQLVMAPKFCIPICTTAVLVAEVKALGWKVVRFKDAEVGRAASVQIGMCLHMSIRMSTHMLIHMSMQISVHRSEDIPICMHVHMSVHISAQAPMHIAKNVHTYL